MENTNLILGTMTFGSQVDAGRGREMMETFFDAGYHEIDTAYVYNKGETERVLAKLLPEYGKHYLATKAHPKVTGRLDGAAVTMQLEESLRRLGRSSVDLLYLHMPEPNTPVTEPLEACARLYEEGKIREIGLSNYPSWMVAHIWHLCKERGWPQPSVYQGLYNGLSRRAEEELFPVLRELGIRFYAYNPLAAGLLSGKYSGYDKRPTDGRFVLLPYYQERYWKEALFEGVRELDATCRKRGIALASAALRWVSYHSSVDPEKGDGIIIGASNMEQLKQNLGAVEEGPLPEDVTKAFEKAYQVAKCESPSYFRYYLG